MANMLVQAGYRVTCLYYERSNNKPFYTIDPRAELINLYARPRSRKKRYLKLLSRANILPAALSNKADWALRHQPLVNQLRDYFNYNKPDLAISFLPSCNTCALMAAPGTGVKVVVTNHNVPSADYDDPTRWDRNPLDRKLRVEALDHATAIHVLFPSFGEWFSPHLRQKVIVIPNYVPLQYVQKCKDVIRRPVILAVGRLAPAKNYLCLLRSWAALAPDFPDWTVRLYGTGSQRRELASEAKAHGVERSFILCGHQSDLSDEYTSSAIFCHPALHEGFGLSAVEALSSGIPVICYNDCDGLNQYVADGINGFTIKRDKNSPHEPLTRGLRLLMQDAELRTKLGANGPASVAQFSFENYRMKWLDAISRLIAQQG
jgi:glycosyltransferase involved in cell wall biosynthesis